MFLWRLYRTRPPDSLCSLVSNSMQAHRVMLHCTEVLFDPALLPCALGLTYQKVHFILYVMLCVAVTVFSHVLDFL